MTPVSIDELMLRALGNPLEHRPQTLRLDQTADQILTSIGRYAGAVLQAAAPDQ